MVSVTDNDPQVLFGIVVMHRFYTLGVYIPEPGLSISIQIFLYLLVKVSFLGLVISGAD